jgi:hypothetical protein
MVPTENTTEGKGLDLVLRSSFPPRDQLANTSVDEAHIMVIL